MKSRQHADSRITSREIRPNIYLVRRGNETLFYAPLKGYIARGWKAPIAGLLSRFRPDIHQAPKPETAPVTASVDLTHRCPLGCRYCSVYGGRDSSVLTAETGRAAIDFVIDNACKLGRRSVDVVFGGGGEPTAAWLRLVELVEHARSEGRKKGVDTRIFVVTNGLFNARQAAWLAASVEQIVLSFDGPAAVQDAQRPILVRKRGMEEMRPSSPAVERTAEQLGRLRANFGIRATISGNNFDMVSLVKFFSRFRPSFMNFQPITERGRCSLTGMKSVDPMEFAKEFIRARQVAKRLGLRLSFPGTRTDILSPGSCNAYNGVGFVVTSEGLVSACEKVLSANDRFADFFVYGRYDDGKLVVDRRKLEILRELKVERIPFCTNCFCRWHCSGGCLNEHFDSSGNMDPFSDRNHAMCRITREIVWDELTGI